MKHTLEGHFVDILAKQITPTRFVIEDGKIISRTQIDTAPERYLLPPFIDAHIHVESSMLPPREFARLASIHGTGATVSDPHEIANVLGIEGVMFMLEEGKKAPFHFHFGAPSCVPATSFETAGATLDAKAVTDLLAREDIGYLAEMMNWPGVLNRDEQVMAKIKAAQDAGKPVDGHAPGLKGEQARTYASVGISTDHECFTTEEALDKLAVGMKILIREGSAARNYAALAPLIPQHYQNMMFCSDDKHPDSLILGHINKVVSRAVKDGYDLFQVLQMACTNPVHHYQLPIGQAQVGDSADLIVTADLVEFNILECWLKGEKVAENGKSLIPFEPAPTPNLFKANDITLDDLKVQVTSGEETSVRVRAIKAIDGELITEELIADLPVVDGEILADAEQDILKIAVVNRYQAESPAVAFINGFGLKHGAIAGTVAHDCHNIIAVGTSDKDIAQAINLLIEEKGGLCAVEHSEGYVLPLPIAGLMSNLDGFSVAEDYTKLDARAKALGSKLKSPYMTLSFMALLVIPKLKLSDKGLFDGESFNFKSLEA
jgi:adenine deaminase